MQTALDMLDWHEATDLLTIECKDFRIAARVRRHGYANRFPHDFTIRTGTVSGAPTELAKIVSGHGDWMFYGRASASGDSLDSWWLIDLRAFRAALIRHTQNGLPLRFGDKTNPDGTRFKWFDFRSFPDEPRLVVARG